MQAGGIVILLLGRLTGAALGSKAHEHHCVATCRTLL